MSVHIMGRVFWTDFHVSYKDKKGKAVNISPSTAKGVMLAISDSADDFGENSYQSFETIAKKASIERRSAVRVCKALIENKYLSISGLSPYGTNNFKVNSSLLGNPPLKRSKNGRPKTSDSGAETSDPESSYPSLPIPTPLAETQKKEIIQSADKSMNFILNAEREFVKAQTGGKAWKLRKNFEYDEIILLFADLCTRKFGEPIKRDVSLWILEIGAWKDMGFIPSDWKRACEITEKYDIPPAKPTSMTNALRTAAQERREKPAKKEIKYHQAPAERKGITYEQAVAQGLTSK